MSFFFLLMKVRRESHLSFCDNLSLSPVISFAPLILIVLYNCVMWTSWSLKYCPYPFIITWCLEPLFIFFCSALYYPVLHNKSENSLGLVILKDFIPVWFSCYWEIVNTKIWYICIFSVTHTPCWQYTSHTAHRCFDCFSVSMNDT